MAADFDPYHKWLGIPPAQQPPHHYRLLGIDLYEGDPDVVANAADRQMGHVRSMASGPYAAVSQRLLNELSAAKLCLLDTRRKSVYDAQLADGADQVAVAAAQASPVAAAPAMAVAAAAAFDAEPDDPWSASAGGQEGWPSQVRRARRRVRELPLAVKLIGHVVASVGGLTLGYLVLCWIGPQYDFLGLVADAEIAAEAEETATTPDAGNAADRSVPEAVAAVGQSPPRQPVGFPGVQSTRPSPAAPPATVRRPFGVAPSPTTGPRPGETVAASNPPRQPPTPRPAAQPSPPPAAVMPAYVDLPLLGESDEATLIRGLPAGAASVRLELLANPLGEDDPRRPRLRLEAATGDRHWSVVLAGADEAELAAQPALARFSLRGGELRFAWMPDAAAEPLSGQLRNALLEIATGGQPKFVALRAPVASPPLVFSLDKKSTLLRLELPDLPADGLRLSIASTGLPVTGALDPPGGTAPFGKRVAIDIEPGIELRITSSKTASGPTLNLSGAYKLPELPGEDLTGEQLAFHQGSLEKQLSDDRTEVGQREGYAAELPAQLQSVANRTLSSNAARAREQAHQNNKEMVAIRREIRKNSRLLDSLKKRIPRIEANLAALRAVVEVGSRVDGAVVPFRLEYEVAGRTTLLATSQAPD